MAGNQLGYADIINGTIAQTTSANAVTFALKTLAGNDPSTDDPVLICFRNATAATGNYVYRSVTAALSVTVPDGATLGTASGVSFDVWVVLHDDAGTVRIGVINATPTSQTPYPLAQIPPTASSTTISNLADSAKTFYSNTGVTSKAYVILGLATYPSGQATAGVWTASPTTLQLFGHGIPAPNVMKASDFLIPKAAGYVTFSGGAPVLTAGFNVSTTITDNGPGDVTLTFNTAFSTANYVVTTAYDLEAGATGRLKNVLVHTKAAGSVRIRVGEATGLADTTIVLGDASFHFACFGTQ